MMKKRRVKSPTSRIKKYSRQSQDRTIKDTFLIVCAGTQTEINYFEAFKLRTASISSYGVSCDPVRLVEYTIKKMHSGDKFGSPFDQVWCVFDIDDVENEQVDRALALAKSNNIKCAISNECFELWYLLHFQELTAAIPRSQYYILLTKHIGKKYNKNSTEIITLLSSRVNTAITRAKRLNNLHKKDAHICDKSPYTDIYILVEELLRHK